MMPSRPARLQHLSQECARANSAPLAHTHHLDAENVVVETVSFSAGSYLLEGELAYTDDTADPRGGVVLAGSHPLLGGNMHNNVVRCLGDGLAERGWVTVRFNYRGVGRSQGPPYDMARCMAQFWHTSHVEGEMELWQDVWGAAAYLQPIIGADRPLVLLGYSFGCALLPSVCQTQTPAAVVLIAPPLSKHDYTDFFTIKIPILVIASTDDFTFEPACLQTWFDRLAAPKRLVEATADNHFFRGHEPWLVETVSAFLSEHV